MDTIERLDNLITPLRESRATHVEWRDCPQEYRDANPDIGNARFHAECVDEYDERIQAIIQAMSEIAQLRKHVAELEDENSGLRAAAESLEQDVYSLTDNEPGENND